MKQKICLWQLAGFALTSLLGTLLHFLYDWTGRNPIAAGIAAVNESTFEHMKLLFWPIFCFALLQWLFFRERRDFWAIKLRGTLAGLCLIPILFHTYNGAIGTSPDWVNIAIFFLAAAFSFAWETRLFLRKTTEAPSSIVSFFLFLVMGALFILLTFYPPKLGLFLDPVSGSYGIAYRI